MKIKRINSINELPHNTLMVLYHAPYFTITKTDNETEEEFAIRCSLLEYRQKYGEPGTIYIHKSNLFIVKVE